MDKRTAMADALHQAGRQSEAESLFREAEEIQKDRQPEYPLMYSLPGFRYCDLLLSQGKYQEVLSRAEQTLEWGAGRLLDIAHDYLSLGKAHLLHALQEGSQDFTQVAYHLNPAVDGLRRMGCGRLEPKSSSFAACWPEQSCTECKLSSTGRSMILKRP
jgi:tetratricopeptide (TPR) repeat protein